MEDLSYYRGKRVLVTGHTGFKGAWLCELLLTAGARVTGYSLPPPTDPSLYALTGLDARIHSVTGDIRDFLALKSAFEACQPEIVFHLAAQPIVRTGYQFPAETYEVNVMGTVNLLECIRLTNCVRSAVIVTTDKVYENMEWEWAYRETEPLNGPDPYSNSKSCAELVAGCYRRSYFKGRGLSVSTVRAGNVIGGGDFSPDRIIPDCVRAAVAGQEIVVRSPHSVRPYQHVLDALFAYLLIGAAQDGDPEQSGAYNVGPDPSGLLETGALADLFTCAWGNGLRWTAHSDGGPPESICLKIDSTRIRDRLGWRPRWSVETSVAQTVSWTRCWLAGGNVNDCTNQQVQAFLAQDPCNIDSLNLK